MLLAFKKKKKKQKRVNDAFDQGQFGHFISEMFNGFLAKHHRSKFTVHLCQQIGDKE